MTHAVTTPEPELQRLPLQECAYALSIALACFAAWAWLSSAGVWAALYGLRGALSAATPGFVLLAVLSFIIQIAANVAAAAARQAQAANLPKEFERARTLMLLGGAYNAVSLHHAFTLVGFLSGDMALLIWPLAGALAFYEPAQYWVDEALAHARAERKARADAQWEAKQEERRERLAAEERARRAASERGVETTNVTTLDTTKKRRRSGVGTAIAATAAAATPMAANALEPDTRPAIVQSAERPAEARVPSMEEVQDARYQLHMKGVVPSYRTVAAHIGVRKCDIEQVWPKGQPLAWESAA
ncbi:MAG: hypothetical protein KJZ75_11060 [Hyphomonadaceae bacterium]|nr:hypothetical protein [Hyphomonadaceae bacterium]